MLKLLMILVALMAVAGPAAAQTDPNRLFADSKLVLRDRFSVEVAGNGPDVVFIPGLASSRATWKATAERLKSRYRLHLVQIAGFSGEPARANADGEVMIPTAEAIDAYLVDQKLTPAVVVGHSLGGTTPLYLAQKHPGHLKKLMVVDALPFLGSLYAGPAATVEQVTPMATQIRNAMQAAVGRPADLAMMERQMARMSKDAATRRLVAEWGVASDTSAVARFMYEDTLLDLRPGLAAMTTPVVVLFPDAVPVGMPAGMAEPLYRGLYGQAKTVTPKMIPDSAHFIMLDQPQAFAAELDAFLAAP